MKSFAIGTQMGHEYKKKKKDQIKYEFYSYNIANFVIEINCILSTVRV